MPNIPGLFQTITNVPKWAKDLTKIMNPQSENDWRLLAQRLGYSNDEIQAWASKNDPCLAVLSQWYATHKTRAANLAVLMALQEMDRLDGAVIVENAMKVACMSFSSTILIWNIGFKHKIFK